MRSPRTRHVLRTGLLVLAIDGIAGASPQQPLVFSSHVQAVLVDALVTQNGRPVSGLTAADFEVRDNGVLQKIDLLDAANLPINAALALDTSASTAGARLRNLTAATDALLDGLRPVDRAALTTFSDVVSPRVPLTPDLASIRGALRSIRPNGETAALDGIYAALTATLAETGRSLLVICTDGPDTRSWLAPDDLVAAARRANAVIDVVATGSARRWPVLRDLTDATGGRMIAVESNGQIRTQFESVLSEFRSRYVLTFVPTGVAEGGFHQLDVRVHGSRLVVAARPGYVSDGSAAN
jgi:VWFA-related protein